MKGKLKLAANKKTWLLVREDGREMQVPAQALTRTLYPLDAQKHEGLEIEYELEKGQPARVREVGAEWQPQSPPSSMPRGGRSQSYGRPPGGGRRPDYERGRDQSSRRPPFDRQPAKVSLPGDFHNPYNFVPAPPRDISHPELGDHPPAGHDRYHDDLWSGRIAVKLTTVTPLLIVDAAKSELYENDIKRDHKIFPVRIGVDGKPYLPPTSIKGMLRSAFEAITNSRFAVFEKHHDRLAYRMAAKIGPIPARVEKRYGRDVLRVMKAGLIGYAGKLPRYEEHSRQKDKGEISKGAASTYPDGTLPVHGAPVWVQLDRGRVMKIERRPDEQSPTGVWTKGWACVTGPNISKKRYERVFLEGSNDPVIPIDERHRNLWRELIQNYQDTHVRDLELRRKRNERPDEYLGDEPGKTGWSRHIYDKSELELREGTLCYVEFVANSANQIAALIPVTISRRLYSASPADLLPESLKPAPAIDHLSPAERVFGWVNQKGAGAYRGNVRIGPVKCVSETPVKSFEDGGLPLAILGQPKPQQARFYVAQSKQGEAQPSGTFKEQAGYLLNKGLRARKVYPHHAQLPESYWVNPVEDRTQRADSGFFQEYRRPHEPVIEFGRAKLNQDKTGFELKPGNDAEQRDDQNRSIKGWVRPLTDFEFEVEVTNLSEVELGALLWLLSLPEDCFHRLGGGKPLGFGSVRLTANLNKSELHRGRYWRASYLALDEANDSAEDLDHCVAKFKSELDGVYGNGDFDRVSFISAFKRSAQGFNDGKPIHYPRALQPGQLRNSTIAPHPEGKAFEWFFANERTGREGGPKLALDDLVNDEGLPILETR